MEQFEDQSALERWLWTQGIATTAWEQDDAKGTADLWAELQAGETRLTGDPPARHVELVEVILRRGNRVLLELQQELRDGRTRKRHIPPSEKFKHGELPAAVAVRCLAEELGLSPDKITVDRVGITRAIRTAESQSYPGLQTTYTVHTVEATADGLPDEDFWIANHEAGASDPIKRHKWGWRERNWNADDADWAV